MTSAPGTSQMTAAAGVKLPSERPAIRHNVGVADMSVESGPDAEIATHALGSCIGVTIWDPVARVGGMLHFMLPLSSTNKEKARSTPAMFADTGVPLLFRRAYELGATKERLIVCAAGGAEVMGGESQFRIGSRNRTVLRKLFWKNNVMIQSEDCGGNDCRAMSLSLTDGTVSIRHRGMTRTLWAA
ncbi:MAG: chemotaxis protein CheD [Phycisphaerales bacterium]